MRQTENLKVGDKEIIVKELTMAEIRNVMAALEKQEGTPHIIDLLFPDMPAAAISISTGLSLKNLEGDFTQSEIKQIRDKVEKLNPFFAKALNRLAKLGQSMLEKQ